MRNVLILAKISLRDPDCKNQYRNINDLKFISRLNKKLRFCYLVMSHSDKADIFKCHLLPNNMAYAGAVPMIHIYNIMPHDLLFNEYRQ